MARTIKKIICVMLVIALAIACASPAFADNQLYDITPAIKQRFGAWVASAMMAGQIFVSSVGVPITHALEWLSDPYDVSYSYADTQYQEWMDKNKIVIDKNHVQIDGVWYDNVWLSNDASEKFRTNAFDLKTALNIANNSNGVFAEGAGKITEDNTPIYNINGVYRTQGYNIPSTDGVYSIPVNKTINAANNQFRFNPGSKYLGAYSDGPLNVYIEWPNYPNKTCTYKFITNSGFTRTQQVDYPVTNEPFEYTWVSKDIDLDPLQENEGLSILVPHEDMQQWYDDNPGFNPQVNPEINIDIDSPDFPDIWQMVDTLIDTIDLLLDNLPEGAVKYETQPDPVPVPPQPEPEPYPDPEPVPYPDPDPDPGTTIPDIDWTDLFKTIKNIYQSIADGNVIKQVIANINTDIRNILDNIKWQFEQTREQIGDIADKIIHGNKDWFSDIVDSIKVPFMPIFTIFKNGVNIWHYVVDWISYIGSPFSFFFQTALSINSALILPIYASLAGTIVIAIYRRFGR